jgi:hypothetical protein
VRRPRHEEKLIAVYVEPARRKKIAWGIAAVALVVGLAIGIAIGRATAPSIDDKIASGRSGGRELVTALNVLPLEYEQARRGSSETSLIANTVARSVQRLPAALDGAAWLGVAQRNAATDAVQSVQTAASQKVSPSAFRRVVARATSTLEDIFGLRRS